MKAGGSGGFGLACSTACSVTVNVANSIRSRENFCFVMKWESDLKINGDAAATSNAVSGRILSKDTDHIHDNAAFIAARSLGLAGLFSASAPPRGERFVQIFAGKNSSG